jgi:hypothetical protein
VKLNELGAVRILAILIKICNKHFKRSECGELHNEEQHDFHTSPSILELSSRGGGCRRGTWVEWRRRGTCIGYW